MTTAQSGFFSIPTRVFLTPDQRRKLEILIRANAVDLSELVTLLVGQYLDEYDTSTAEATITAVSSDDREQDRGLRQHELSRLRSRLNALGDDAPAWLASYLKEIERELNSLHPNYEATS